VNNMSRKQKQQQPHYLEMSINTDTMIGIAQMHVCADPRPIPRGYQIFKAELRGTQLTLRLRPFFRPTLQVAVEVFGLPEEVPAQVWDWYVNTFADPVEILQVDDEMNDLAPIPAEVVN
jgi:hypothetical protein